MGSVAEYQADSPDEVAVWRQYIATAGVLGIVVAVVFEIVALLLHQVTTVKVTGKSPDLMTITTTGPGAPPSALVGGIFGGGALLCLAAAFFNRITKIVLPGGAELDIAGPDPQSQAQLVRAIAAKNIAPDDAVDVYQKASVYAAVQEAQKARRIPVRVTVEDGPLIPARMAAAFAESANISLTPAEARQIVEKVINDNNPGAG